jgi:3'-phosphoadenosine 5'-phosphosulfate sulfotransferase
MEAPHSPYVIVDTHDIQIESLGGYNSQAEAEAVCRNEWAKGLEVYVKSSLLGVDEAQVRDSTEAL